MLGQESPVIGHPVEVVRPPGLCCFLSAKAVALLPQTARYGAASISFDILTMLMFNIEACFVAMPRMRYPLREMRAKLTSPRPMATNRTDLFQHPARRTSGRPAT